MANLITHEAAHTYGANHVGDVSATMNPYLPINPLTTTFGANSIPGSDSVQDTPELLGENLGFANNSSDDYGDDRYTAAIIGPSDTIVGRIERRDDADAFTFTAQSTGIATIQTNSSVFSDLDSYLTVYQSGNGSLVAENDDYNGQTDSYMTFNTVAGQSYTIVVSADSAGSSGSYSIDLSADSTPRPILEVTDSSGAAGDMLIDFGTIAVDGSGVAFITIANEGSTDLHISELTAMGSFSLDMICTAASSFDDLVIEPGSARVIGVTFEADQSGQYNGTVSIVSNDFLSPTATVSLVGSAQDSGPDISITSGGEPLDGDFLQFPEILRNTTGSTVFTIHNGGLEDLVINDIDITDPFIITGGFFGAPISVPGQGSVDIVLTAIGVNRGSIDGELQIVSNDPDQPETDISLSAHVIGGALSVQEASQAPNDNHVEFGHIYLGDIAQQTVTLSNSGDGPLVIEGIVASGPFESDILLDGNYRYDDITVAPGQSLTVELIYSPEAAGSSSGTLLITTNDTESTAVELSLTASSQEGGLEIHESDGLDDGNLDIGKVLAGSSNRTIAYEIFNHSTTARTVSLNLADDGAFSLAGPSTVTIEAGRTYQIEVDLQSDLAIAAADTLTITAAGMDSQSLSLTADIYALIGDGHYYRFTDHSGDMVMVILTGSARAELRLGVAGQADIESIELLSGSGVESLCILAAGSGTEVNSISGSGDLAGLIATNVDIVGDGINLDGSLQQVLLGDILDGADVSFAADRPALMLIGRVAADSDIDIDGALQLLRAEQIDGGAISATGISTLLISEQSTVDIDVTQGNLETLMLRSGDLDGDINVNGRLGMVMLANGDLLGQLNAQGDIGRIMAFRGTISGSVNSSDSIGMIFARDLDSADIFALRSIDQVTILNDMSDSTIAIGYDGSAASGDGGAVPSAQLDAYLGVINVNGTFSSSIVAVGINPAGDGDFFNGTASAASGKIGTANLRRVETDNGSDPFGLIAQNDLKTLRVNLRPVTPGYRQDDFVATTLI